MKNLEVANLFYAIANIYEIKGVEWKPRAYRKAAQGIETLGEDIEEVYRKRGPKGLMEIAGVGERIAQHIEEYLKTGRIKEYEDLKKGMPQGLEELLEVPGLGPKKAYFLYKRLKVKNVGGLEKALKAHKIADLPGFGAKSEENLLRSLELRKKGAERMLLGHAAPIARMIVELLRKVKGVEHVEVAGSLRRKAETIGDIDVLVTAGDSKPVMDAFVSMPDVVDVVGKGSTKSTVMLKSGAQAVQADVRVVEDAAFGSALQYFTGSKYHNIELRTIAIKKGYKLSEYGLFKGQRRIAGETEEGVYRALGLPWIPPELRENTGEIKAAQEGKLPKLVDYKDVKGDLHVHTKWSDGDDSTEEIASAAKARGYEFVCITDHSKGERVAHGLDEERLLKHIAEIKQVSEKLKPFRVFAGSEVDIKANGELDYGDDVLKKLDVVEVSVHSGFKTPRDKMTERILAGLDNKHVKVFCHPTGRVIGYRPGYEVDFEKVFEKCAERKIALEVNSFPDRLDLNGENVKKAIEMGCRISIGTDSHNREQLRYIELGVAQARRGWAEKKDVLNTYPLKELCRYWSL